jgi:uncharacterized protein YhaN
MQLLANGPAASTIGIILAASAGMVGAIAALLKLPRERNESAVIQAQGAMETMERLNEALEEALVRANDRGDLYRDRLVALQARYDALEERFAKAEAQLGPFPNGHEGGTP